MPLYEYVCPETGTVVEALRPVEMRDEPLTLILRRRPCPTRIGVVAGGIGETTFEDNLRAGYHELEKRKGSRFRSSHDTNTINRALER